MPITIFFILIPIFLAIDYLWIGLIAKSFYVRELAPFVKLDAEGALMVRMIPAGLVYIIMSLGLVVFVLPLVSGLSSYLHIFFYGFLFGAILYGIYDFTNYAIFPAYTLKMLLVDMFWGSLLCGLVTCLMVYISKIL